VFTDTLLRKLNAAARLLTRTGRWEHITPVLRQLHWLPVSRRIDFKLAVLMYQISPGLAPTYLQDRCRLASEVSSGRRLRSANVPTLVVPCTRTKLGDHSFAAARPRLWNSLPGPLRQSETLATFKRQRHFCFQIRLRHLMTPYLRRRVQIPLLTNNPMTCVVLLRHNKWQNEMKTRDWKESSWTTLG